MNDVKEAICELISLIVVTAFILGVINLLMITIPMSVVYVVIGVAVGVLIGKSII